MHDAPRFLTDLSLVLCAAALTTAIFQRLRQSVVLGHANSRRPPLAGPGVLCDVDSVDASELVARESIRDLVAQYAHGADRGRFDDVAALFADDGVLELPDGRRLAGPAEIRAFLRGTGETMRAAVADPFIRHHVSSHRIIVESEHAAVGYAYFLVVTERGPDHWGRYVDRYVRVGTTWRFASRRVRLDGYAPGSLAAERRR